MRLIDLKAYIRQVEDLKISPGKDWPEAIADASELALVQLISAMSFRFKRAANAFIYGDDPDSRLVIFRVPCKKLDEVEVEIINMGRRFCFDLYYDLSGAHHSFGYREIFFKRNHYDTR